MNCTEARELIDAGVHPGRAGEGRRAAFGAHLAHCAACQAYRDQVNIALLGTLLSKNPATPFNHELTQPEAPIQVDSRSQQKNDEGRTTKAKSDLLPSSFVVRPSSTLDQPHNLARPRRPAWLRYMLWGLVAVVVGSLGFVVGQIAFATYTISRNIQAMQLATPALTIPDAPTGATLSAAVPLPQSTAAPLSPVTAEAPVGAAGQLATDPALPARESGATAIPGLATAVPLPGIGSGIATLPTLMPTIAVSPPTGDVLNILLLGADRRPGESWTTRSDSIVVLHLDQKHQRVAMLSLPRDLIVPIPGYGQARINAATVYGDIYPELGGGIELARQTVSEYLGIPIDYVVRADFNAFTTAIDAIGGIDINVEEEIYDPEYPTMDYGYMEAYFAPGPQHMDGETALIYARVRHMDSNYARNRRQQQVLMAIMQRVRDQNLLGQVQTLADLTTALRDDIQTDLSLDQMIGLAWTFRHVSTNSVEKYALDETMVSEGWLADDPYATFAAPGAVDLLVQQLLNGPTALVPVTQP